MSSPLIFFICSPIHYFIYYLLRTDIVLRAVQNKEEHKVLALVYLTQQETSKALFHPAYKIINTFWLRSRLFPFLEFASKYNNNINNKISQHECSFKLGWF